MTAPIMPKLAEVASINPKLISRPEADDLISFIPMSAVDAETGTTEPGEDRPFAEVSKGYTVFAHEDILVAKITPCFENGKIAQARLTRSTGVGSTEFHVIRPDRNRLDSRYLLHFLRRPAVRVAGERRMTGSAGQRRVPEAFLAGLPIPTPPLEEQRRIAEVLDRADELRAKRREALAHLDDLTQSIFLDIFGDRRRKDLPWEYVPFGAVVKEFRYGTSTKSGPTGFPTLRIPNVVRGTIDLQDLKTVPVTSSEFERLQLQDGDLLFVRTNGNPDFVGRCAVFDKTLVAESEFLPNQFVYASYLIRVRVDATLAHPTFVQHFMSGGEGRAALREHCKTSAGQYNLNTQGLSSVFIPLPPLSLQEEFVRQLAYVEELRARHDASEAELDDLFASLQDRAFRGLL